MPWSPLELHFARIMIGRGLFPRVTGEEARREEPPEHGEVIRRADGTGGTG